MTNDNEIIAAKYRYFTTDLLTNEVLMEIPFVGVSYGRALKAGGDFSGTIPVIPATSHLELHDTTMPGQTGLYIVRNGVCVWGGIIWDRTYDVQTKQLSVSGTEFTSYLHHRLIWKTVNYQYSATVTVGGGTCAVQFDNGSTTALVPGASVQLEFYDPEDFSYNGYYIIAGDPPPTTNSFTTTLAAAVASIVSIERVGNIATVTTDGFHGFNTGDVVTLRTGSTWDGTYVITADQGSASTTFTFKSTGANFNKKTYTGTATRPVPDGEYDLVTVTTRADTYDYMRGIVTSIFDDFMGIDFADDYLTPGTSYEIDVINKKLGQNFASLTTAEPHTLAVGQAVKVSNIGFPFDGEFEVVRTPDDYTFMYNQGGLIPSTAIQPIKATITARAMGDFVATMSTSSAHGFTVGQTVVVDPGDNMDGMAAAFSGTQTITAVPTPTSFSYSVIDTSVAPKRALTQSTASVGATKLSIVSRDLTSNVVSISTATPNTFTVGNAVTVSNLNVSIPIVQKALDSARALATVTTSVDHELKIGDSVSINGLQDASAPDSSTTASQTGSTSTLANRTNSFANPSGKVNTTNYTVFGTGTLAVSAGLGTYLSGIPISGPFTEGICVETIAVGATAKLLPNTTYTYSGNIGGALGGAHLLVTGSGVASVISPDPSPLVNVFFNESLIFTTAASGTISFYVVNAQAITTANVGSVSMNSMKIDLGIENRDYFDGSTPASGIYTYAWTGGANNSPAIERVTGYANQTITLTTSPAHNFKTNNTLTVEGMVDNHTPTVEAISGGVATLTIGPNNVDTGAPITVDGVTDTFSITSRRIQNGIATVTLDKSHGFSINDSITVAAMDETYRVVSKEIQNYTAILTTQTQHNIQISQEITVTGQGAPFDSPAGRPWVVTAVTSTRIFYKLATNSTTKVKVVNARTHKVTYATTSNANWAPTTSSGTVTCSSSVMNGDFVVTAVPTTGTLQFEITANDVPARTPPKATLVGLSPVNGSYTVSAVPNSTQIQYLVPGKPSLSSRAVVKPKTGTQPTLQTDSFLNGVHTITSVSRTAVSWRQNTRRLFNTGSKGSTGGIISTTSIFNGTHTITDVPTSNTLRWAQSATSSVIEVVNSLSAFAQNTTIFNGTYTITSIDPTTNTFRYNRTHSNIASTLVSGYGAATVSPTATISSYGSYPGNTDIGIEFDTRDYSGVNVPPVAYRGYALTNAGTALDSYSATTDGFEYRIDCGYNYETNKFTRTFILLPINFPNPPPPGEASDPSRFGADKLVFEYPGNVISVKLDESAENSVTRFFVVGNADLGQDAAQPYSAASATDLLNTDNARSWPILDDSQSVDNITDENVLYAYASQYLSESRPPDTKLSVTVNGSLQPTINTFYPGDWCSIIIDDDFFRQRLASNLEPRNTVIVRKIDSYKVTVPNGTTFPETVDLTLVAEWDVDKVGV